MCYRILVLIGILITCSMPTTDVKAQVQATLHESSIDIIIDGHFFTSYIFSEEEKYPYFFPVNGPSGASVTSKRNGTYPHHSSLFFGCDKVNGGNYWQESLQRGQIRALQTEVVEIGPEQVVIKQECVWTRPDALAPIKDQRMITISAPDDHYQIDFEVTLLMLMDVTIDKTNHSFFSARMDPDLSVVHGGTMVNAAGARGEKATFGKASPWMDIHGERGDLIEGLCIMQHPSNRWYPAPWFTRDYGFFSPTPMYWPADEEMGTVLTKGKEVTLRYRVLVHEGDHIAASLQNLYDQYRRE